MASHLLKWIHYKFDSEGVELELKYFRDVDKREVDFVVVENKKPILLIECNISSTNIDSSLSYLKERCPSARAVQVVLNTDKHFISKEKIEVIPASKFLKELVR